MNSKTDLNTEDLIYENRTFYRSTFMEVSIIRTNDNFYNATKIVQDNGYENFNKITRLQFWKKFYETVKSKCRIDIETKQIKVMFERSETDLSSNTIDKNLREIVDSDLMFEIQLRASETKWISGIYIHEILLNKLLMYIDNTYALKISYLLNIINEELHLRNINLETKIQEQQNEIKKLQADLEALKKPEVNSIVEKGQYKFEKTDYNGISVLREVTTGYYNATKMCKDNCKNIKHLHENKDYEELKQAVSEQAGIPASELLMRISDRDGFNNNVKGTYVHPLLVNYIAMWCDKVYAVKVSMIMSMINEELHLKNITLEQKIEEKAVEIEELKDKHEKASRSKNHDYPGCITLRLLKNELKPRYKMFYYETRKALNDKLYTIENIYNPKDTYMLMNYYVKHNYFNDVKFIREFVYKIDSFESFEQHIYEIQKFEVEMPEIDRIIRDFMKSYYKDKVQLKAKLFEAYCSEKYNIPLASYTHGEKLSLSKSDMGLDLLDTEHRIIGQCKYYIKNTLEVTTLRSFLRYCEQFEDYVQILFVPNTCTLSQSILNLDLKIEYVDDVEFNKWYENKIEKLFIYDDDYDESSSYKPIKTYVRNKLIENAFVYIDDLINEIEQKFDIKLSHSKFSSLFSHIYRRTKHTTFVKDLTNDKPYIVFIEKAVPIISDGKIIKSGKDSCSIINLSNSLINKIRNLIIKTLDNGQYKKKELISIIINELKTDINVVTLMHYFKDLFIVDENYKRLIARYDETGNQTKVFELKDGYKQNIKLMKDYLRSISMLDEQTIADFNTKFHRYDGKRLVKDLLKRLDVEINKEKHNEDRIKLIKAMKCGQYTKEEFIDLIHETFGNTISILDIIAAHRDILNLIPSKRGNKPYSRCIDGKDIPIYELRKEFMPPDELQELKNMIINHKGMLKDLIPYFNDRFSRHDTNRSINYFLK